MTAAATPAPTLGDLLADARRRSARFAPWLAEAEPGLLAQLQSSLLPDECLIGRVRAAIADFEADASESDWATLVSAARDAEDPGQQTLAHMLRWSLEQERQP